MERSKGIMRGLLISDPADASGRFARFLERLRIFIMFVSEPFLRLFVGCKLSHHGPNLDEMQSENWKVVRRWPHW